MRSSVLERMLKAERHRRKSGTEGSASTPPVAIRFAVEPDQGPWVTTLYGGVFAPSFRDKDGTTGHALTEIPIESEGVLVHRLYGSLLTLRALFRWNNVVKTVAEARQRMVSFGFEPKNLIVPFGDLAEVVGSDLTRDDAEMLMLTQGCVAEVGGVKILTVGDELPKGSAILSTVPTIAGVYTRIHDHVGLTIFQADRTVVLVSDAVA